MYPFLILILAILAVPVFLYLQYRVESKLLSSFSNINEFPQEKCLNEFTIRLIQLSWMPLTGRCSGALLFNKDLSCSVYKDFVVLSTIDSDRKYYSRLVYKQNISVKKDLFAGNIISFDVDGIKLVFQVYSRDLYFK